MLNTYFSRQSTLSNYYNSPVGQYLDDFSDWLSQYGYRYSTIKHCVQNAVKFTNSIQSKGHKLEDFSVTEQGDIQQHSHHNQKTIVAVPAVQPFFIFLQSRGILKFTKKRLNRKDYSHEKLLCEFESWMRIHRGVVDSTLIGYRRYITDFLSVVGDLTKELNAKTLRKYISKQSEKNSLATIKSRNNAIRMFIRFLIATERCDSNLNNAIPAIAQWKLSSLPKYILPDELERVITGCNSTTAVEIRNKSIVLLLARLGLRASEVADLQFEHINWQEGTLKVIGKTRHESVLPLPVAGEFLFYQ